MAVLLWNIVFIFCDRKRDQWHVFFWDFVWWFWWTEVVMSLSGFWNFLVQVSFDHAPFSDLDMFISSFMVIPCIYWSSFPFLFRRNSWYVDTKIRWLVQIGGNPIYVLAHDLHGWNVFAWLLFPSNRHAWVAGTTSKVFATSILVILVDETGGKGDFKCGKPLFLQGFCLLNVGRNEVRSAPCSFDVGQVLDWWIMLSFHVLQVIGRSETENLLADVEVGIFVKIMRAKHREYLINWMFLNPGFWPKVKC